VSTAGILGSRPRPAGRPVGCRPALRPPPGGRPLSNARAPARHSATSAAVGRDRVQGALDLARRGATRRVAAARRSRACVLQGARQGRGARHRHRPRDHILVRRHLPQRAGSGRAAWARIAAVRVHAGHVMCDARRLKSSQTSLVTASRRRGSPLPPVSQGRPTPSAGPPDGGVRGATRGGMVPCLSAAEAPSSDAERTDLSRHAPNARKRRRDAYQMAKPSQATRRRTKSAKTPRIPCTT